MKEVKKNVAEEPQVATTNETRVFETANQVINEKKEELKLKFSAKVNVLVSDKELQEKLHKVVSDAIDEGIVIGKVEGLRPEAMDFMTGSVKELIERVSNPTDAQRASKYKQLYYNQRMISTHLESALQFANAQVATYETGEQPFTSPLSRSISNVLGTTALGLGGLCRSNKENQLD